MYRQSLVPRCFALNEAGEPCRGYCLGFDGELLCNVHVAQFSRARVTLSGLMDMAGLSFSVDLNEWVARMFSKGMVIRDICEHAFGGDLAKTEDALRRLNVLRAHFQAWFRRQVEEKEVRPSVVELVPKLLEPPALASPTDDINMDLVSLD